MPPHRLADGPRPPVTRDGDMGALRLREETQTVERGGADTRDGPAEAPGSNHRGVRLDRGDPASAEDPDHAPRDRGGHLRPAARRACDLRTFRRPTQPRQLRHDVHGPEAAAGPVRAGDYLKGSGDGRSPERTW